MPTTVKACPICRAFAAFKSWRLRRQKARLVFIDQVQRPSQGGQIRQAHGPLPSREERESWLGWRPRPDDGWKRVDSSPEQLKEIVPPEWARRRRQHPWLR